MRRGATFIAVVFLLLSSVARADQRSSGYLLHLPGVGGARNLDRNMVKGLQDGGLNGQTRIYDWTGNKRGLDALLALERNRQQAKRVAEILTREYRSNPKRPIYVTAHSGGTGIAIWALENLPEDVQVHTLVLIASALSPGYDLEGALRRVTNKVYTLHSSGDSLVLGTGTTMFGTIDGIKTPAAGLQGFETREVPEYAKLHQLPHDNGWIRLGNNGTHIGPMNPRFARNVLAPLILRDRLPPITKPTTQPTAIRATADAATRPTTAVQTPPIQ